MPLRLLETGMQSTTKIGSASLLVSMSERFEIQTVGGSVHQEYWIPAAELTDFNQNIVGKIEVVAEFRS